MKAIRRAWARLANSVHPFSHEVALQREIASHIEMQTDEYVRQGMSPSDAARAARLKFGSLESVKETYRDERRLPFFELVGQDLRYAFRGMRRSPGLAIVAILSLAIGIGANTAIFSVVNGVLLRALPYKETGRLFAVREAVLNSDLSSNPANPLHIREWKKQCPSLESVAAVRLTAFSLLANGESEQIQGARIDPELFATLGLEPHLGRTFGPDEAQPGKDRVVIVADSIWRRRFGADPGVVGRSIDLTGQSYIVVGILPPQFRLPFSGNLQPYSNLQREPEIYQPLVVSSRELRPMGNFNYGAIARLRPGAGVERALAELNTVQAQFPKLAGESAALEARLFPLQELFVGNVRLQLWTLMGAVAAVLLIVCVNLANLLIARMTARTRESAIRAALGASRGRQLRQFLTESVLLSTIGGSIGVALAFLGVNLLVGMAPSDLPRLDQVHIDTVVLAFAAWVSIAAAVLSGLLPAYMIVRKNPHDALKSGSHTATATAGSLRMRYALVGVEVALGTALLIVAGLLTTSFIHVLHIDKGFETQRVLALDLSLMGDKYQDDDHRERFFRQVLQRLRDLPTVVSAAVVSALPTRGESWIDPIAVEGDTRPVFQRLMPNNRFVSPEYFRTMGIRIVKGRSFEETDRGHGYGVLSQKLAERLWPGQDPIGKRFVGQGENPQTVIGVVADVRTTLTSEPVMIVYYPYWLTPLPSTSVVVRTTGDPMTLAPLVRAAIKDADIRVPIRSMKTLDEVVDAAVAQRRFQLIVVVLFAASALAVASLGIYGVVSFSVARRRTEMGLRLALGAQPADLLLLVIRQGMTPVALGLLGGIALALSLSSVLRGLLFGVTPSDPGTIAIVLALLAMTALVACLIPARAAASSDPVRALRLE
jgi:putative ABC transport system permease protein